MHDVQTGFIYIWYGKDITTEGLEKRIGMKAWKHIQKNVAYPLPAAAAVNCTTICAGAAEDNRHPDSRQSGAIIHDK